jgi:hypothetical protein
MYENIRFCCSLNYIGNERNLIFVCVESTSKPEFYPKFKDEKVYYSIDEVKKYILDNMTKYVELRSMEFYKQQWFEDLRKEIKDFHAQYKDLI